MFLINLYIYVYLFVISEIVLKDQPVIQNDKKLEIPETKIEGGIAWFIFFIFLIVIIYLKFFNN